MARYSLLVAVASVFWAAVAVGSMTTGTTYNWPDFVHVNYGVPMTFATHTLNTIAGPADKWSLDTVSLSEDLIVWLTGMVVLLLAAVYLERRTVLRRSDPSVP